MQYSILYLAPGGSFELSPQSITPCFCSVACCSCRARTSQLALSRAWVAKRLTARSVMRTMARLVCSWNLSSPRTAVSQRLPSVACSSDVRCILYVRSSTLASITLISCLLLRVREVHRVNRVLHLFIQGIFINLALLEFGEVVVAVLW